MSINLTDIDTEAELEDLRWAHYRAVANRMDIGDLLGMIGEEIGADGDDTPLSDLLEGWAKSPDPDFDRPSLRMAEAVGAYITKLAAKIFSRELDAAVARSTDRDF
jgi:hypothetical protein